MSYLKVGKFREVANKDGVIIDPFSERGRLGDNGGILTFDGTNVTTDIGNYSFSGDTFSNSGFSITAGTTTSINSATALTFDINGTTEATLNSTSLSIPSELRIGTETTASNGVIRLNGTKLEFYDDGAYRTLSYYRLITELHDDTDALLVTGNDGNLDMEAGTEIRWEYSGAGVSINDRVNLSSDGLIIDGQNTSINAKVSSVSFTAFGDSSENIPFDMNFLIDNIDGETLIYGSGLSYRDNQQDNNVIMSQTTTNYAQNAGTVLFTTSGNFQVDSDNIYLGFNDAEATPASITLHIPDDSVINGRLDMGSNRITNIADPTADTDATTKSYVDGVSAGDPRTFIGPIIKIGFAGDEVAQSIAGLDLTTSPLAWVLYNRQYLNVNIHNSTATSGELLSNLSANQLATINSDPPDVLIISIGSNDTTLDSATLETFIDGLDIAIRKVIVLPVLPGSTATDAEILDYNNQVENTCATSRKCTFINAYPRVIDTSNDTAYAFRAGLSKNTKLLSAEGAKELADIFVDAISPLGNLTAPKGSFAFNAWSASNIYGNLLGSDGLFIADTAGVGNGWVATGDGTPSIENSEFIENYTVQRITFGAGNTINSVLTYDRTEATAFGGTINEWFFSIVVRIISPNGNVGIPEIVVEFRDDTSALDTYTFGGQDTTDIIPIDDEHFFIRSLEPLTATAGTDRFRITVTTPIGTTDLDDLYEIENVLIRGI